MISSRHTTDDGPLRELRARAEEALLRSIVLVWERVVLALNVPNTGVRRRRVRGRGSYTVYPSPSKPGEPPRKRTGWLQSHVKYEVDAKSLSARVGLVENAGYGVPLELGTRNMAARPWLVSTARACADAVREIFARAAGGA